MTTRLPTYGAPLLFLIFAATAGCDRLDVSVTEPAPASGLSAAQAPFSARPLPVRPEFLHGTPCVARPAFGARLSIIVRGEHDLILRGLRFGFTDRFGGRALPEVFAISSLTTTIPTSTMPASSPVPFPGIAALPGASPIPIPGSSPVHGLLISAGTSRTLPFFLRFGCGFAADGVLLVSADAGDRNGRFETSELRVRIAP